MGQAQEKAKKMETDGYTTPGLLIKSKQGGSLPFLLLRPWVEWWRRASVLLYTDIYIITKTNGPFAA